MHWGKQKNLKCKVFLYVSLNEVKLNFARVNKELNRDQQFKITNSLSPIWQNLDLR